MTNERPFDRQDTDDASRVGWLYRALLWIVAAILMIGLLACTPAGDDRAVRADTAGGPPIRLILARAVATDSAAGILEYHVDQVLRQVFDSIPGADWVTLNVRDSITASADSGGTRGIALRELGERLGLDGAVSVQIARFGGIMAADFQVLNPADGRQLFRETVYQQIRFRDSAGSMLLGPALYDVLARAVRRFAAVEHSRKRPVATAPLVLSAVVIPKDTALGPMSGSRDAIATAILGALNEYASLHFAEVVPIDPVSRNRLYEVVRAGSVANTIEPGALERRILFGAGIDHFLVGSVAPLAGDSLRLRLEIRYVQSPGSDSLRFVSEMTQPKQLFSSSAYEEDVLVAFIDLAEPLFRTFSEFVASEYARARAERSGIPGSASQETGR